MKAVTYDAYGGPEVLELVELPTPTPGPGEVLVRIRATSVTAGDARMRAFDIPGPFRIPARFMLGWPRPKNRVLGFEFAGDVEALGPGVTKLAVGDRVYGCKIGGSYAEHRVISEEGPVVRIPEGLSYDEAASLPFGALTALHFLRAGKVGAGQHVLVVGASGCVGSYGVQVAKSLGATVTAVTSGPNAELVRGLGADAVIDYTKERYTASGSYDAILETVGAVTFRECLPVLRRGGVFLNVVMSGADIRSALNPFKQGRRLVGGSYDAAQADLLELNRLVERAAVRPVIDRRYPLERIREAHAYVDTKRKRGTVVITVG